MLRLKYGTQNHEIEQTFSLDSIWALIYVTKTNQEEGQDKVHWEPPFSETLSSPGMLGRVWTRKLEPSSTPKHGDFDGVLEILNNRALSGVEMGRVVPHHLDTISHTPDHFARAFSTFRPKHAWHVTRPFDDSECNFLKHDAKVRHANLSYLDGKVSRNSFFR